MLTIGAGDVIRLVTIAVFFLLANLAVLGMNIKLYTEILKDRKFDTRADAKGHDGGRRLAVNETEGA